MVQEIAQISLMVFYILTSFCLHVFLIRFRPLRGTALRLLIAFIFHAMILCLRLYFTLNRHSSAKLLPLALKDGRFLIFFVSLTTSSIFSQTCFLSHTRFPTFSANALAFIWSSLDLFFKMCSLLPNIPQYVSVSRSNVMIIGNPLTTVGSISMLPWRCSLAWLTLNQAIIL